MASDIRTVGQCPGRIGRELVMVVLIILAIALCFADVLFLPYTFYYQDIQFLHYPGKIYFTRTLQEGNFGFWNPYIFAGYPLQAEPEVGPLYPFNALFLLPIPPYRAQTLFVVLHYATAGCFTFLLGRRLGLSRAGAVISALVYACSGYMMAQLTNFSILTAMVWLPLILLLFSATLDRKNYGYAIATGAVIALFILTAHPQFILLTLTVVGLFWLYEVARLLLNGRDGGTPHDNVHEPSADRFASGPSDQGQAMCGRSDFESPTRRRTALKYFVLLVVAVGVGGALAAPQLLPAYQLKSLSVLSESLGFDFVTSYSLSPYRMVSFLIPNFLGNQATGYRGPAFYEEHHNYIGILPLVLVVGAWARRRHRAVLFFGLLLVLAVVLSWGRLTPVYEVVARMPLYNLFRVPARWLYPMTMSLAILAGFGFDHLLVSADGRDARRLAYILVGLAVALTLTLPWVFVLKDQVMDLTGWFVDNVYPSYAVFTLRSVVKAFVRFPEPPPSHFLLRAFPFMANPLLHFLLALDLSAVVVYCFVSGRLPVRWFRAMAATLIAFDLFLVSGSAVNPVAPAAYFDRRESTAFLQEHVGLYRIYPTNQDGDPNFNLGHYFPMIYQIPSFGGSSSLTIRWAQEYRDAARQNPRLYDLAGVKYVLQEGADEPHGFSGPLRQVFCLPEIHIWENPNVMPRAFIVHEALTPVPAYLYDPEFPFDTKVVLDDPAAVERLTDDSLPASRDRAEITHYSYNEVTVECETGAPGFLVLTDSLYPGWEVTVDGQPERVYRADHIFRAVFLPAGRHTVAFRFVQPVFWWGVAVAALTSAGILAVMVVSYARRIGVARSSPTES